MEVQKGISEELPKKNDSLDNLKNKIEETAEDRADYTRKYFETTHKSLDDFIQAAKSTYGIDMSPENNQSLVLGIFSLQQKLGFPVEDSNKGCDGVCGIHTFRAFEKLQIVIAEKSSREQLAATILKPSTTVELGESQTELKEPILNGLDLESTEVTNVRQPDPDFAEDKKTKTTSFEFKNNPVEGIDKEKVEDISLSQLLMRSSPDTIKKLQVFANEVIKDPHWKENFFIKGDAKSIFNFLEMTKNTAIQVDPEIREFINKIMELVGNHRNKAKQFVENLFPENMETFAREINTIPDWKTKIDDLLKDRASSIKLTILLKSAKNLPSLKLLSPEIVKYLSDQLVAQQDSIAQEISKKTGGDLDKKIMNEFPEIDWAMVKKESALKGGNDFLSSN